MQPLPLLAGQGAGLWGGGGDKDISWLLIPFTLLLVTGSPMILASQPDC